MRWESELRLGEVGGACGGHERPGEVGGARGARGDDAARWACLVRRMRRVQGTGRSLYCEPEAQGGGQILSREWRLGL